MSRRTEVPSAFPEIFDERLVRLGARVLVPRNPGVRGVLYAAILCVMLLVFWRGVDYVFIWAMGMMAVLTLAVPWIRYILTRRSSRAIWASLDRTSWSGLAECAIVSGRRTPRRGGVLNTSLWFGGPGPGVPGPRPVIICVACSPRSVPGEDPSEPTSVGPDRRTGAGDRPRIMRSAAMLLLILALLVWGVSGGINRGNLYPLFWVGFFALMLLPRIQRLGISPIQIGSAIASPGRVEVGAFGSSTVFTAADSVLYLQRYTDGWSQDIQRPNEPSAKEARVMGVLIRSDRKHHPLMFDHDADPGLSDLVARWLAAPK